MSRLATECLPVRLRPAAGLLSLVFCLLASGCLLPKPEPDPTRFYVLSTDPVRPVAAVNDSAPAVLYLREVELAEYLRTRPLIVRRGENEIEFREFALWGEPLGSGIARVLREELLARGVANSVVPVSGRREESNPARAVSIRVLACEGGANGEVVFRAIWQVAATGEKAAVVARGDYRPADLRWDGKSEASLAARLSEAVTGLADEIARALRN